MQIEKDNSDVIIVIWESKNGDVLTRPMQISKKIKSLKLKGKKPTKIIAPAGMELDAADVKILKSMIGYKGLVITTGGVVIYKQKLTNN